MNANRQVLINGAANQVIPLAAPAFNPQPPQVNGTLIAHAGADYMTREELALLPVPETTKTHKPIPHIEIVDGLIEALGFRHIYVVKEEFCATSDGGKMFGLLELNSEFHGCRFAIGLRNSNDKSMRLALTIGYRVFVCDNMSFKGDFTPVLTKHSNSVNLIDLLAIGVDRMQRGFEPLTRQVQSWQETQITDDEARLIIYQAFVEKELKLSTRLLPHVHEAYFNDDRFEANTFWRLSNAFTSGFKKLDDPLRKYQATARLGNFLQQYHPGV
jgi:hypothetical protein